MQIESRANRYPQSITCYNFLMIANSVTIFVDFLPFPRAEAAAVGEDNIDWQTEYREEHVACILSFAATEIASHLNRIADVEARIEQFPRQGRGGATGRRDQHTDQPDSTEIYLTTKGSVAYAEMAAGFVPLPVAAEEQSFAITSTGERGGERGGKGAGKQDRRQGDRRMRYLIAGSDATGALYGAYELLERFGFRWLSPDAWDQITPKEFVPVPVEAGESPSFQLRGFWATDDRGTEPFLLWMARNKLNLWSAEQQR